MRSESILLMKHGALGDIVLASGHIKAIRKTHPQAHITCLTSKPWKSLLEACPWVDEVWVDTKPRGLRLCAWRMLLQQLRSRRFSWVYDLQTSSRSTLYWWFLPFPKPNFSGIARFASHRQHGPERHTMHSFEQLSDQLRIAGISADFSPDISWLQANISPFSLPTPYALLVPGGSAHRPEKRWPAEHYATLAHQLLSAGITPVLLGTQAEQAVLETIAGADPRVINLGGKTGFSEIAELARHALWAIGNDTGPIHLIAATGCPVTVIFSHASDPAKSAPPAPHVRVLREADLKQLSPETVWGTRPL